MRKILRFSSAVLAISAGFLGSTSISWALDPQAEASLKLQEQDLSRIAATESQPVQAAMQSLKIRKLRPVSVTDNLVPRGFQDGDDYSSLPFLLDADELQKLGMKAARPEIPEIGWHAQMALKRESPVYKVHIHAIRTANDNGTHAATISPQEIKRYVDQANRVWWSSGIEFVFDPDKDFEHRDSTLLNYDCTLDDYWENFRDPDWSPTRTDGTKYDEERMRVGNEYKGKLVVFFRYGNGFQFDEEKNVWKHTPGTGGFSSSTKSFVAMPRMYAEMNLLAHEIGHYMHLPHPFAGDIESVQEAAQEIRNWVEVQGHATQNALLVFDGDNIERYSGLPADVKDTPPDARGAIFVSAYGEGANCKASYPIVQIPVLFSGDYQTVYTLRPDRLNIMSYFKHCYALGTQHLSGDQIAIARNALINGNRMHLLQPSFERRPAMQKAVQQQ